LNGKKQDLRCALLSEFAGFDMVVKATCKIGRLQRKIAQQWCKNDQVWTNEPIGVKKSRLL
jgi:hypothetical protein